MPHSLSPLHRCTKLKRVTAERRWRGAGGEDRPTSRPPLYNPYTERQGLYLSLMAADVSCQRRAMRLGHRSLYERRFRYEVLMHMEAMSDVHLRSSLSLRESLL